MRQHIPRVYSNFEIFVFLHYSRLHDYSVPRIHFAVPDSHMDCDYLVSGTIYKVLLLIQSHSFAEYAPSLQSADFTSDQDMVLWHVSIHNDYLTGAWSSIDTLANCNKVEHDKI